MVYLSPFLQGCKASLVQREVAARRADGGIVLHRIPQSASLTAPLHKRAFPVPTIILQITMLVFVKGKDLY